MSEDQSSTPENKELIALKQAHDMYATTCHLLKTRSQFYYEEFQGVIDQVGFYTALKEQVLAKIHEIEPPAPKEPKKPYLVDVPMGTAPTESHESSGHAPL